MHFIVIMKYFFLKMLEAAQLSIVNQSKGELLENCNPFILSLKMVPIYHEPTDQRITEDFSK